MSIEAQLRQVTAHLSRLSPADRILVTIDGPCGSGKSTLAAALAEKLACPVVHMDDFVIPHAQKTPERLRIPGGNADQERLLAEVIHPWMAGEPACVRPYLCHEERFGAAQALPAGRLLILEGTYCNLPAIARHASLRLFLTITPCEQQRRLLGRVGTERLRAFNDRWIPLENAYFAAFGLPDTGCCIVTQDTGL